MEEKNPVEPLSAGQKPGAQVKILCWYVTCFTYTLVWKRINVSSCGEGDRCHSLILLWHVICAACFALLSHYDDLHPHETLSVQSYEFCDSPSITVIQTSCLRGNYLFWLYQCLHQPCDHNSVRGYIRVSLVSPFVSCCLCVSQRRNAERHFSHCCCITTLGGRHCIVGLEWIKHWWLLGTHHVTRSCWQGHELFSRSSITMLFDVDL